MLKIYRKNIDEDLPLRSTMGSLSTPLKYTKSVFSIQSPTERPTLNSSSIFLNLKANENNLDDFEKIRQNRKVHSSAVKSPESHRLPSEHTNNHQNSFKSSHDDMEHTQENENSKAKKNSGHGNKLKIYTAIPTTFTPNEKDNVHYGYELKTTPQYKKYSYTFLDSDQHQNKDERINDIFTVNKDEKIIDNVHGTIEPTYGTKLVKENNINNHVQDGKEPNLPDFKYRIILQTTTPSSHFPTSSDNIFPSDDTFRDTKYFDDFSQVDDYKVQSVVPTTSRQPSQTRSKILQGYFDSEEFQFPLVSKDRLKTLPSTSQTILEKYTKDDAALHNLQFEINKTILPPNALRTLPSRPDLVHPTLPLSSEIEYGSQGLDETQEVLSKYYNLQNTNYLGNDNPQILFTSQQPDSKYTYALQSQFFVPHLDKLTSRKDDVGRTSKFTYKVLESTTPSTISNDSKPRLHLQHSVEEADTPPLTQPPTFEGNKKGKRYGYTLHSTAPSKIKVSNGIESVRHSNGNKAPFNSEDDVKRKITKNPSNEINTLFHSKEGTSPGSGNVNNNNLYQSNEGELKSTSSVFKISSVNGNVKSDKRKYGYKLTPTPVTLSHVTQNPIEQEARSAKSIQPTSPTKYLPTYTQHSQFFIPYDEEEHPIGENTKKYTYHVIPQHGNTNNTPNKNGDENSNGLSKVRNSSETNDELFPRYPLDNTPPPPTESLLQYTYALHSTPTFPSLPTVSSDATSATAAFDGSGGQDMATSNSLPQFTYAVHSTPPTPSKQDVELTDAYVESRTESRYRHSTPLALGHYPLHDLSVDTTSTSWLKPDLAKGLGLPKYRVHQLPLTTRTEPHYKGDLQRQPTKHYTYRLLTSTSPIPPLFYGDTIVIDNHNPKNKNHEKQTNGGSISNHIEDRENKVSSEQLYHPEHAPLLKDMFPNTAQEVSSLIDGAFGSKIIGANMINNIIPPPPTTLNLTIRTPAIIRKVPSINVKIPKYNRKKVAKIRKNPGARQRNTKIKELGYNNNNHFSELDVDYHNEKPVTYEDGRYSGVDKEFGNYYDDGKKQRVPYIRHPKPGELEEDRPRFKIKTKGHIERVKMDQRENQSEITDNGKKTPMMGFFMEKDNKKNQEQLSKNYVNKGMSSQMDTFEKFMDQKFTENFIPNGKGDENNNASILPRPTEAILKNKPYKIPITEYEGYELQRLSDKYPGYHNHNYHSQHHHHQHQHIDPTKYVNPTIGNVISVSENVETLELIPSSDQGNGDRISTHPTAISNGQRNRRPYNKPRMRATTNEDIQKNIYDRHDKLVEELEYMSMEEDDSKFFQERPSSPTRGYNDFDNKGSFELQRQEHIKLELSNSRPTVQTQVLKLETEQLAGGQTTNPSFLPPKPPRLVRLPGIRPFTKTKFLPPIEPMLRLTIDGNGKSTSDDFLQLPFSTKPPTFPSLSSKSPLDIKNDRYVPTEIPMSLDEKSMKGNAIKETIASPSSMAPAVAVDQRRQPSSKGNGRQPISLSTLNDHRRKTNSKSKLVRERSKPKYQSIDSTENNRHQLRGNFKTTGKTSEHLKIKTGKYHYSIQTPNSYTSFNLPPPRKKPDFTKTPPLPRRRPQKSKVCILYFF